MSHPEPRASTDAHDWHTRRDGRRAAPVAAAFFLPYLAPPMLDARRRGWIDDDGLARLTSAFRAWGDHPAAFPAMIWCEAIGWTA